MYLNGPMYSKVLQRVQAARPTGTTTRVTLVQQRVCIAKVCPPMIYHVGLLAEATDEDAKRLFEHGPITYDPFRSLAEDTITVPLPPVKESIHDILAFEQTLSKTYVVGIRDCRHHVLDLLEYLYR